MGWSNILPISWTLALFRDLQTFRSFRQIPRGLSTNASQSIRQTDKFDATSQRESYYDRSTAIRGMQTITRAYRVYWAVSVYVWCTANASVCDLALRQSRLNTQSGRFAGSKDTGPCQNAEHICIVHIDTCLFLCTYNTRRKRSKEDTKKDERRFVFFILSQRDRASPI